MKAHNERNSEAVVNIRKPLCSARERILEGALKLPVAICVCSKGTGGTEHEVYRDIAYEEEITWR